MSSCLIFTLRINPNMHTDKTVPIVTQNLTQTGGTDGTLTVASTTGFFTNQLATLSGNGQSIELVVLDVESTNVLRMGQYFYPPFNSQPARTNAGVDLSAYTVAGAAVLRAGVQKKPDLNADQVPYFTYQPDPTSALRVYMVDPQGNYVAGTGNGSVTILNTSVSVNQTLAAATFQYAKATNTQITAGNSTQTQGFPLVTLARNTKIVQVFNSLNVGASLAFGGVETYNLEPGDSFSVDAGSDGLYWASGTAISVFYNAGITATTGTIRFVGQG